MKNPSGNKLEKLIFGMFDQMIEGADKYVTKQGSTWLIFTEDKRWVIEFTNDKTLWFNYNIFQSELELIGKYGTEEKDFIKKWFESRFLNKPKVEETLDAQRRSQITVEHTIQDGVKHTHRRLQQFPDKAEEAIQNGVKQTKTHGRPMEREIEDTIQNGVKETYESKSTKSISLRHAIKNGVKHVEDGDWLDQDKRIDDIIENGVKETKEISNISLMSEIFKVKAKQTIRDGVKEIQPLPARDGNRDWGLYYQRQGNLTKPHTEYVKEVIEDSYNHMGRVEGVIRNTDKDGI
jgi:predicted DNA-binding protein